MSISCLLLTPKYNAMTEVFFKCLKQRKNNRRTYHLIQEIQLSVLNTSNNLITIIILIPPIWFNSKSEGRKLFQEKIAHFISNYLILV